MSCMVVHLAVPQLAPSDGCWRGRESLGVVGLRLGSFELGLRRRAPSRTTISSSGVSERCPSTRPPASRTASRSGTAQSARSPTPAPSCHRAARRAAPRPRPPPRWVRPRRRKRRARRRPAAPSTPAMPSPTRAPTAARSSARWSSSRSDTPTTADVVAVAHHERSVDDPDLPDVAEACQLFGDPTLEQVAVREADHECLDGSDGHGFLLVGMRRDTRHDHIVSDPVAARITQM